MVRLGITVLVHSSDTNRDSILNSREFKAPECPCPNLRVVVSQSWVEHVCLLPSLPAIKGDIDSLNFRISVSIALHNYRLIWVDSLSINQVTNGRVDVEIQSGRNLCPFVLGFLNGVNIGRKNLVVFFGVEVGALVNSYNNLFDPFD